MSKPKVLLIAQESGDFLQVFEMLNSLSAEVKTLSIKFEGSKHVDTFIISASSFLHFFIKPASAEILDSATAADTTKNGSEFIHGPKSGKPF